MKTNDVDFASDRPESAVALPVPTVKKLESMSERSDREFSFEISSLDLEDHPVRRAPILICRLFAQGDAEVCQSA